MSKNQIKNKEEIGFKEFQEQMNSLQTSAKRTNIQNRRKTIEKKKKIKHRTLGKNGKNKQPITNNR